MGVKDSIDENENDEINHVRSETGEKESKSKDEGPNWGWAFFSLNFGAKPE